MNEADHQPTTAEAKEEEAPAKPWSVTDLEIPLSTIGRGAGLLLALTETGEVHEHAVDALHICAGEMIGAHGELQGAFEGMLAEMRSR